MTHPYETIACSHDLPIASRCLVKLYEAYSHVSYIEVSVPDPVYLVITKADPTLGKSDLVLEGRGAYTFVEDGEFDSEEAARARCEEYERDWREHDRAYRAQQQKQAWRQFLTQPFDVQEIAGSYGIFENTIRDYVEQLAATRPVAAITNGDVVAMIERKLAEEVVIRHGDYSIVTTRRLPSAYERIAYEGWSLDLRDFFAGEVLGLLTEMIINDEAVSFLIGGCSIAATGLWMWMRATTEQLSSWGIAVEGNVSPQRADPHRFMVTSRWYHPKHVVAEVNGLFLDAAGVSTAAELLARYEPHWPGARIVAYNPARLTRYGIRRDHGMSREVAKRLACRFGPFRIDLLNDEALAAF